MKKIAILVLFFTLPIFSFAQTEKIDIKKERNEIYNEFEKKDSELYEKYLKKYKSLFKEKDQEKKRVIDSLYTIDYRKYYDELKPYKKEKVEKLKELLKKINDANPLIGKTSVYLKDNPEDVKKINEAQKNPEYADFEFIGITKNEETDFVVNKENIQTIRQDFVNYFDASYFDDSGEATLSAKISFILDSDGYIKKLKPLEGNEEFAYFCAISLYEMHKKYEPSTYKGNLILARYALPIKMNFE